MIKITRFFYIHWLLFPLILLSWVAGGLNTLLMAYAVTCVHELFHLFAALLLKERIGSFIIMPFGMTLRLSAGVIRDTEKEIMIALAGPFANIIMLSATHIYETLWGGSELALFLFRSLNLIMLVINLLPCMPLDGGRVVKVMLIKRLGYLSAISVMRKLSRIITALLLAAGSVLLIVTRMNVSLIMAAAFLAFHMAEEQRRNEYIIMREILYSKEKLRKRGVLRSQAISAMDNIYARDIFKMLGYDKFYVIHVVDSDLKLIHSVTEAQLIDSILEKGWHIFLSEVC